jgi:hypothetical protein
MPTISRPRVPIVAFNVVLKCLLGEFYLICRRSPERINSMSLPIRNMVPIIAPRLQSEVRKGLLPPSGPLKTSWSGKRLWTFRSRCIIPPRTIRATRGKASLRKRARHRAPFPTKLLRGTTEALPDTYASSALQPALPVIWERNSCLLAGSVISRKALRKGCWLCMPKWKGCWMRSSEASRPRSAPNTDAVSLCP